MGAAGRTRGGLKPDFNDLELVSGPHFGSFLGSDGLNSMFLFGFVSWLLLIPIFVFEILTARGLKTRFSYRRYCKNHASTKIVF